MLVLNHQCVTDHYLTIKRVLSEKIQVKPVVWRIAKQHKVKPETSSSVTFLGFINLCHLLRGLLTWSRADLLLCYSWASHKAGSSRTRTKFFFWWVLLCIKLIDHKETDNQKQQASTSSCQTDFLSTSAITVITGGRKIPLCCPQVIQIFSYKKGQTTNNDGFYIWSEVENSGFFLFTFF